jgi:hypothetical protein
MWRKCRLIYDTRDRGKEEWTKPVLSNINGSKVYQTI